MKCNLTDQVNIGKGTASKLMQVGIDSYEKLVAMGSKKAFLKLQEKDKGACLSLLYGLEGAISGVKWHQLQPTQKQELKQFHKMVKKATTELQAS